MDQGRVAKRRRRRWMSQNNRLLIPNADVWPQASDWLIRDEFTDTRAAGSVNGTAATPGPGTRAVTDTESKISVGSGVFAISGGKASPAYGDPGISYGSMSRATGLVHLARWKVADTSKQFLVGFGATVLSSNGMYLYSSGLRAYDGSYLNIQIFQPSNATYYAIATILRSTGALYLVLAGGQWTLLWVSNTDSDATLSPRFAGYDSVVDVDYLRVIALPAPFDTDDGLATDTHSGSVADGTTFTHEPNMLLEFTQTTVPSADNTEVAFRYIDASNGWSVRIFNNGSIYLLERYQSPSSITRGGVGAGTVTNGMRIVVIADSTSVKVYGNNTLLISYASATTFLTETGGKLIALGTDGAVSNLKTWPRTLSGTAASILNKVSA